jgi:hypothetical protein
MPFSLGHHLVRKWFDLIIFVSPQKQFRVRGWNNVNIAVRGLLQCCYVSSCLDESIHSLLASRRRGNEVNKQAAPREEQVTMKRESWLEVRTRFSPVTRPQSPASDLTSYCVSRSSIIRKVPRQIEPTSSQVCNKTRYISCRKRAQEINGRDGSNLDACEEVFFSWASSGPYHSVI